MTLTALLLAGGLSSRMGQDKATLMVEGEPLWVRQLARLQELRPEAIWISGRTAPSWAPPDIEVVLDDAPSRGPLSGIAAALARLKSSHLLVFAVDLPRMTSQHLHKLANMAQAGRGVIPFNKDHLEPLAAVYPKEAAGVAQNRLAAQDFSMRSFAGELLQQHLLKEYALVANEMPFYLNVNTPGDLCG